MTTSTIKPSGGEEVPPAGVMGGVGDVGDVGVAASLSKRDSEEDTWASKGYNYINPFVHRIEIDSHIEVAKVSEPDPSSLPPSPPTTLFLLLPLSISPFHSCKSGTCAISRRASKGGLRYGFPQNVAIMLSA
ncbi:hypothetical protein M5D96_013000 [Drosophila gunungcola]|uniref:Uncharacterized protein n=1 Tax=Drosophila gunungcola TaxID=103775 RepID=A0A9P9YC80_9MUSC|nr:hypothetical protein M5D96_013000 [Drosophila gunungcola]